MSQGQARALTRIEAVAASLGGRVGVLARDLADGREIAVAADERFPLASCFKIPVMVAVMRQVDRGALRLDERLTLAEADKSPGSTLLHCHAGLQPTVRDLLYLMITLSDNTATDMLWRRVGLDEVNAVMRALALHTIDCHMPDREFFLMECGLAPGWEGLSGADAVARWREVATRGAREQEFAAVLEANADLTGQAFLRLSDARWGRDGERDYADSFAFDQALDNLGSPRDMADLLAMIAEGRCASGPSCALMLEILSRQEWREKIPAGLPAGLRVANKTGGVSGTSNDAAIVMRPDGTPLVMVVFWKELGSAELGRAAAAIADIAAALWDALGQPA